MTHSVPGKDRFSGCLLGLAVGDALGQPVEAFPADRIRREFGEVRDFRAGDPRLPMPLGAGQWTDDTQMMLDITRSILRVGGVDGEDIAREFVADHEAAGIRFSGFAVTYALRRLRKGIPWDRSGLDDEMSAGNGAAMRIAPVGLLHYQAVDRLPEDVRLASISTHRHPEAVAGALAVAYMVAEAASGTLKPASIIEETVAFVGPCKVTENLERCGQLLGEEVATEKALKTLRTTGYVVHTMAAATYCFLKTPDDFERSVIDAVMGGDDADTTAAVTGAISGAYNGEGAIPQRWLEGVESGEEIRSLSLALWELTHGSAARTAGSA
jgi:ADP-ribosyl-[dinitrogen reductase] hydrolase